MKAEIAEMENGWNGASSSPLMRVRSNRAKQHSDPTKGIGNQIPGQGHCL